MIDKHWYRKVILQHQLLRPTSPNNYTTKEIIQKLSYIQIDSLNIVNRAHHHTLWNRVHDYHPDTLNTLVKEKEIFEYWSHAASYLPLRDYKFALVQMNMLKRGKNPYFRDVEKKDIHYVLDKIKNEGALRARDFKSTSKKQGSWWNWKPYKKALEKLFMEGDLMVCHRYGMEKVYDLKQRVLPEHIDTPEATLDEYALYLIDSTLQAHGVATLKQMIHLRGNAVLKKKVQEILKQKMAEGSIKQHISDDNIVLFAYSEMTDIILDDTQDYLKILSPFDNTVIHRDKLQEMFNFDYKIECYTPKQKRVYGYFCLPILFNDTFVARVDCKAHRDERILEIIHLHFEENFNELELFAELFAKEIKKYALFNHCNEIILKYVSPNKFFDSVKKSLVLAF